MRLIICITTVVSFLHSGLGDIQAPALDPSILTQMSNIGDCQACKIFVESFKKGLERTSRGKYEGGDAAWEEEKLKKSYKRSEIRLIDIQDHLCEEERKYKSKCQHIAEKAEEFIEEWWAKDPDESVDLYGYICIDKLQVCCPPLHYGKDCNPCLGDLNNICSGNGKCRGDGTRKGNGTCACNAGYTGDACDVCAPDHYQTFKADGKMLCLPCDKSCLGGCRAGSQKDCVACKPGYTFDSDDGCLDKNECDEIGICTKDQFCLNSIGSYMCAPCDKSCSGCHGDGPDMCRKCAKGYSKKGELCIADREDEDSSDKLTAARCVYCD